MNCFLWRVCMKAGKRFVMMRIFGLIALIAALFFVVGCPGEDDGSGDDFGPEGVPGKIYRLENQYNSTGNGADCFMLEKNGKLGVGAQTAEYNLWQVMDVGGGKKALKNYTTGKYVNVKGVTPDYNAIPNVSNFEDDPSFYWTFTPSESGSNIVNSIGYLTINAGMASVDGGILIGTVQYQNYWPQNPAPGYTDSTDQSDWGAAKWTFWEATDL